MFRWLDRRPQLSTVDRHPWLGMMIAGGEANEAEWQAAAGAMDLYIRSIAGYWAAIIMRQSINSDVGLKILMGAYR